MQHLESYCVCNASCCKRTLQRTSHLRGRLTLHTSSAEQRPVHGSSTRCEPRPVGTSRTADMAKKRRVHDPTRGPTGGRAPGILPTLPQELLDAIITKLSPTERLSVFRSCKALRNAVLNCTPGHSEQPAADKQQLQQQLRTRLFLAAGKGTVLLELHECAHCSNAPMEGGHGFPRLKGMSRTLASNPLQLAAHSKHDIHLHICPTTRMGDNNIQPWLSAVFHPWLMSPPITPSLQHVTSIWLWDCKLRSPLPLCIGRACPALRSYTLWGVSWARSLGDAPAIQPWPQLTELTLHNCKDGGTQLGRFLQRHTLSKLAKLSYRAEQEQVELYTSILTLSKQLTSLEVDMPWGAVGTANKLFTFSSNSKHFVNLTILDLPQAHFNDKEFIGLLQAAPALQQLSLGALHLEENHTAMSCSLQRFHIKQDMPFEALCSLARLPTMPNLQCLEVNIPAGIHVDILLDLDLEVQLQAAAAWLEHLHMPHEEFKLSFDGSEVSELDELLLALNLQALSRILSNAKLLVSGADMDEWIMRALGSACFPCIRFQGCTWGKGTMALLWSWMPATIDVTFVGAVNVADVQALCLGATRPVTVQCWDADDIDTSEQCWSFWDEDDIDIIKRALEAAGKTTVTLLHDV